MDRNVENDNQSKQTKRLILHWSIWLLWPFDSTIFIFSLSFSISISFYPHSCSTKLMATTDAAAIAIDFVPGIKTLFFGLFTIKSCSQHFSLSMQKKLMMWFTYQMLRSIPNTLFAQFYSTHTHTHANNQTYILHSQRIPTGQAYVCVCVWVCGYHSLNFKCLKTLKFVIRYVHHMYAPVKRVCAFRRHTNCKNRNDIQPHTKH